MIYLDNAATSYPKPESVCLRIDEILRKISGSPGRASHRMALEASRVIFNARETAARLLNAPDSSRIVFTKNATEGINIALKGLLDPGDHVISTSFEHNSVMKTLDGLEKTGVEVTRIRPGSGGQGLVGARDIENAIKRSTKIVCITHASNVFGAIQPVAEAGGICKAKGIIFMVDAAQTAGAYPIDLGSLDVDILVATGHKALMGPQGTGFIYIREGIEPRPLVDGGTGDLDTFLEIPERLENGTMNTPGVGGLSAGIEFLLKEGVAGIRRHEEGLIKGLLEGLKRIEGISIIGPGEASKRVSLVAFNVNGKAPAEVGLRLDEEFSIMVRTGAHCAPYAHREAGTYPDGAVRVSPGYFSTEKDIEEFLRAISIISKK